MKSSFQKNLQKKVFLRSMLAVSLSMLLFVLGQTILSVTRSAARAGAALDQMEAAYRMLEEKNTDYLLGANLERAVTALLEDPADEENIMEMENLHRRFLDSIDIGSDIVITDRSDNVLYSSFSSSALTSYLYNYNNAVIYQADRSGEEVYRAVYSEGGGYADTMLVRSVRQGGKTAGHIALYISGSDWNYYLSEADFDGVITDERDNVMYASRSDLAGAANKFGGVGRGIWKNGENRYWAGVRENERDGIRIYALIYYPFNYTLTIGTVILVTLGLAWFLTVRGLSSSMAAYNAASIERLISEIRIITEGNAEHRISLETGDEFEEAAQAMNRMLDTLEELNRNNSELIRMNAEFEMSQLTAQMNPHFLYNTLEIIRSLALFDAKGAEEVIESLTEVLRYSIERSEDEVTLAEDMHYIGAYLKIQKIRFGERFACRIDLPPECLEIKVPRLLLQPLIENSIKYTYRTKPELIIHIRGEVFGDTLTLYVRDNGPGVEKKQLEKLQQELKRHDFRNKDGHIGLHNLSRRLYLKYGKGSGVSIRSPLTGGFEAAVRISRGCTQAYGRDPAERRKKCIRF